MSPPIEPSAKPARRKRSQTPQLLVCAAMLLVAWGLWRRAQPERLPGTLGQSDRFNAVQIISHGLLYRTTVANAPEQSGPRMVVRTVFGGERVLLDEDPRY